MLNRMKKISEKEIIKYTENQALTSHAKERFFAEVH